MSDFAPRMVGERTLFDRGNDDGNKAVLLFPNQGLHAAARWIGISHPRAIQYLEQAPVIALGALVGGPFVRRANILYVAHILVPLCERGAPLKDVMRAFNIAPQLRPLKGSALIPSAAKAAVLLSAMDPAVLGRIVPEKPRAQQRWLSGLASWTTHMVRRGKPAVLGFEWAAERLSQANVRPADVSTVADFIGAEIGGFNPLWKWPRAVEEAARWHAAISVDAMLRGTPFKRDTVIDIGKQPDEFHADGLTFTVLRTPLSIADEGTAMHHCVTSYIRDVIAGRCHIVSVRRDGERVATLELSRELAVRQIKGLCNRDPGGHCRTAAGHYAFELRKLAARS